MAIFRSAISAHIVPLVISSCSNEYWQHLKMWLLLHTHRGQSPRESLTPDFQISGELCPVLKYKVEFD